LQQLEAAGAADRADHLAGLHLLDGLREGRRDLVEAAPAQVAAFQRVRAVGIAHGGGGEGHLALVDQRLARLRSSSARRRSAPAWRHPGADQDVGQVELLACGRRGGGHGGVDLGLADVDAALGEALAEFLGDDLVAQVVAEFGEGHAVLGQPLRAAGPTLMLFCWATPCTARSSSSSLALMPESVARAICRRISTRRSSTCRSSTSAGGSWASLPAYWLRMLATARSSSLRRITSSLTTAAMRSTGWLPA
jgi:hypothetical protein